MKIAISFTVQILVTLCFLSFLPGDSYAGGGHAHFGRSEFVNGGMSPAKISQSLAEIEANIHHVKSLLLAGDLSEVEDVAINIRETSSWIADNANMNRARHTNLKRASKSISKAADKLKKYALAGDASKAKKEVDRIHKFLRYAL